MVGGLLEICAIMILILEKDSPVLKRLNFLGARQKKEATKENQIPQKNLCMLLKDL